MPSRYDTKSVFTDDVSIDVLVVMPRWYDTKSVSTDDVLVQGGEIQQRQPPVPSLSCQLRQRHHPHLLHRPERGIH